MNTASRIIGNHALFFHDGQAYTVPSGGTASRTAKPGAADPKWIDLGIIMNLSVSHEREEKEIYAPLPGQFRLHDILETKRKLGVKFDAEQLSPIVFQLLFGTLVLDTTSTQYNPLEGVTVKGWLKVQQYDQSDVLVNTVDLYVRLKIGGEVNFNDDVVKAPLEALTLHSTLNTGALVV